MVYNGIRSNYSLVYLWYCATSVDLACFHPTLRRITRFNKLWIFKPRSNVEEYKNMTHLKSLSWDWWSFHHRVPFSVFRPLKSFVEARMKPLARCLRFHQGTHTYMLPMVAHCSYNFKDFPDWLISTRKFINSSSELISIVGVFRQAEHSFYLGTVMPLYELALILISAVSTEVANIFWHLEWANWTASCESLSRRQFNTIFCFCLI